MAAQGGDAKQLREDIDRARAAIENMTKEKQAIIVTEIPYQVNKARLVERIAAEVGILLNESRGFHDFKRIRRCH